MRIDHLTDVRDDGALVADVVLVGSGPAGLTLARELSGSGLDVLLLESGGLEIDAVTDGFNEIENVGLPRLLDQRLVRARVYGGSSSIWSGRAVQLDDIDFAERAWIPNSGWPIERRDIEPYFTRAAAHIGTVVPDNLDSAFTAKVVRRLPAVDPAQLHPYAWVLSQDAVHRGESMRFGPRALAEPMSGVRALVGATVVEVCTTREGDAVIGLVVADAAGVRRRVHTDRVVLAGGGIENARMLLASRGSSPEGVGNRSGLVGRFLMDHLRGPIATAHPADHAALQRVFGDRWVGGSRATPGYALSPALQEREELVNGAAWLFPVKHPDDPFTALARRGGGDLRRVMQRPGMLARGAARRVLDRATPVRLLSALELYVILEQTPDAESRVLLSDRTDALGVPLSRIDRRVGEQEVRTARRLGHLMADAVQRVGRRPLHLLPLMEEGTPFHLYDSAHPMGTTRMASDAARGVVDENCAVHGVRGLWVAGSSVFSTGGHANPTGMIVALAVRLADHLRHLTAGHAGASRTLLTATAPLAADHGAQEAGVVDGVALPQPAGLGRQSPQPLEADHGHPLRSEP